MVTLYDTTLRDGTQREGLSLSVEDKLRIVSKLDLIGIDYVEGGFPGSNPKDIEFFERARSLSLEHAVVTAFGATRRKDLAPEDDPGLQALLDTGCQALCIFGKTWDVHVTETLMTTLENNVQMVRDSIAFLKAAGRTVFFDAEHFFDGYKADTTYALEVCRAAADAGADAIVLCDTNGGTLPHEVLRIVGEMGLALDAKLGIHAHNDAACA
ncbi:MAG: citramalate synthase, partial [Actinobacteria bacterium]